MNKTERKIMAEFLDRLSDSMGNAGCNDYDLPKTQEGRDLAKEVEHFENDDPQSPAPMCCSDFVVLAVLRKKLGI